MDLNAFDPLGGFAWQARHIIIVRGIVVAVGEVIHIDLYLQT
jgi:hypothetical protein